MENGICQLDTATITGGALTPALEEVLEAKWFTFDEIRTLHKDGQLRTDWVFETIQLLV